MALPDSHQKSPDRSAGNNLSKSSFYTSSPSILTWAKITQPERVSLVLQHRDLSTSNTSVTTYSSRIWHIGRSDGSVLFDASPIPGSSELVIDKLMSTFPTICGILNHRKGKRVIFEINLKHEEERLRATEQGV